MERLWDDTIAGISRLRFETGIERGELRRELEGALHREALAKMREAAAKESEEAAREQKD